MKFISILAGMSVVVIFGSISVAEEPARRVNAEDIDAWLEQWADSGFLSGCVLVASDEDVLYERCFGEANAELGVVNTPTTRFAIASVTKALQLVLLARLVDDNVLTLEDTLSTFIAGFPRGDEITIRHITDHQAGIPHRLTEPRDEIFPRTATDMVELVKEKGLSGDPGGEESYSSGGYSVLARVLEVAGGASWADLMKREVFDVAGMNHTVHPEAQNLIPERASSYRWTPLGYRLTEPKDLSFLVGAGSLYSTPRDLLRFIHALVEGKLGSTAQEHLIRDGIVRSNGLTNGYRTFVDYDAGTGLAVVFCGNVVTGAVQKLRTHLPMVFAGEEIPVAEIPDIEGMFSSTRELSAYEGSYQLRPGRNLAIRSASTYLDVDGWMLLPMGSDSFFCVQDFGKVVFDFGEDEKPTGLRWGEDEHPMPRVGDVE